MAGYKLSYCTVDDAGGLAKSNASAFWEETWWNLLWENRTLQSIIDAMAARTPRMLLTDRSVRRHEKVVHEPTGEVVGYARWFLPPTHYNAWLDAQVPEVPEEQHRQFQQDFAGADFRTRGLDDMDDPIHEMMKKHEPQGPYIKLDYICTRPDHQRQGVASLLVQSGVAQAQKLGIDVYLVAMGRAALRTYLKQGFQLLDESQQNLKKWGGVGLYETFVLVWSADR